MSSQNLENLSIQELEKLVKELEEEKKKKLILASKKLIQDIKNIKKTNFKTKSKTFEDYYQDCIKGKDIPKAKMDCITTEDYHLNYCKLIAEQSKIVGKKIYNKIFTKRCIWKKCL